MTQADDHDEEDPFGGREEDEDESECHFLRGRIYAAGQYYLTAIREDLESDNQKHTFIYKYLEDDKDWTRSFVDNRIADFLTYESSKGRTLLAVAEDGEVVKGIPGGVEEAVLDPSDDGPSDLRKIRALRKIGGSLYAVGMRRQVYKSDLDGLAWTRVDGGMFVQDDSEEVAGLWSIAGPEGGELIVVGLSGDLWRGSDNTWTKVELPTNVNLYDVICLEDGSFLACGARGLVLRGSGDTWETVTNDATETDFWSAAEYGGTIYLAGDSEGLFSIRAEEVVADDAQDDLEDVGTLDVADGLLIAVGDQSVYLFDGENWVDLEAWV